MERCLSLGVRPVEHRHKDPDDHLSPWHFALADEVQEVELYTITAGCGVPVKQAQDSDTVSLTILRNDIGKRVLIDPSHTNLLYERIALHRTVRPEFEWLRSFLDT